MKTILVVHRQHRRYWIRRTEWTRDPEKAHWFTQRIAADNAARKQNGQVGTLYEARKQAAAQ